MEAREIKELRIKLGLSQRELGNKIGATKTSVYKWESSRCIPHHLFMEKLDKLARFMEKSIEKS
ncbi:MAG: helix-turn-helix transcriptional regulator [Patescibacteria group bacterium]|jgi:DNA-binding XRE family transcriptional regulator